jgi:hypothetical protein
MPTIDLEAQTSVTHTPQKREGQPLLLDKDFLLSVINPLPLFLPMTIKRAIGWLFLLSFVAAYVYVDHEHHVSEKIYEKVNSNLLSLMIFFFAYEPAMFSIAMLLSRYPSDEEYNHFIHLPSSPRNSNLAIIIACHDSADVIAQTVRSCLVHATAERIFVMDNGRGEHPSDNTKEVVHAVHPGIRYFYLSKTANKTIALLVGALYIREHHPEYNLSLIIDDDVIIPESYKIRTEFFEDPCVKGIVYPIRADSPYQKTPRLVAYQDLEYQIADLEMAFLDRTKSVIRPHGAASLWDTETLINVFYKHNAIFKGDDVMMGHILQHLHVTEGHAKLRIDMLCHFKTTTPQSYLGAPPNLYQQRVRSWSEAQFLYPWNLSIKPLLTVWMRSPLALLSIKSSQIYNCYTQLSHIMRIPIMIMLGHKSSYWLAFTASMFAQSALIMTFNHAKLPARLRVDWFTACTYPAYKIIDSLMGTIAFTRVLLSSGASAPDNASVENMIEHHLLTLPAPDVSPKSPRRTISQRFNFFNKQALNTYTIVANPQTPLDMEDGNKALINETIMTRMLEQLEMETEDERSRRFNR